MKDKRPRIDTSNHFQASQCIRKDDPGVFTRDVPAGKHKRSYFRGLQGETFELPVADALVARQDDPAIASGFGKPVFIGSASRESVGEPFDVGAGFAQGIDDGKAVERLVDEERYRLKRP